MPGRGPGGRSNLWAIALASFALQSPNSRPGVSSKSRIGWRANEKKVPIAEPVRLQIDELDSPRQAEDATTAVADRIVPIS
jgi:hypothetical protein